MKTIITLFYGLNLWLISSICFAAETTEKISSAKTLTTSPISSGALLETFFGLVLVLITIAFLAWLLRRTNRFQATANGEMKIIAGLPLGTRERALLLQVGEQQILVGVTAQQIQTLLVLEKPIHTDNATTTPSKFAEKLQQMMQKQQSS
ncbi:MAG: flagellar biosynthetic protein FliO [Methylophagaceae bacterium]